jgi:hypothetical protein
MGPANLQKQEVSIGGEKKRELVGLTRRHVRSADRAVTSSSSHAIKLASSSRNPGSDVASCASPETRNASSNANPGVRSGAGSMNSGEVLAAGSAGKVISNDSSLDMTGAGQRYLALVWRCFLRSK